MTRIFLSLSFVLAFAFSLVAQTADPVYFNRTALQGEPRMCMNDAGEIISFGPLTGQSTDFMGDTIYLCLNDTLAINHDETTIMLDGDPNMDTDGGIGYAFFDCPPTTTGPDTSAINNDPCVLFGSGMRESGFLVYTGFNLTGDVDFFNTGQLQSQFFGGQPGVLHFAPITFDSLRDGRFAAYEGSPAGSCVNLRADQAFAIAYLNAIAVSDVTLSGCEGSFRVQGGLPELDGSDYTNLSIVNTDDPTIIATIDNPTATDGDLITFTVPEAGTYSLLIEDGKSCALDRDLNMGTCGSVQFIFPFTNMLPNTNECIEVTVANFDSLVAIEFTIEWDPSIIDITDIQGQNPTLSGRGPITASWNANAPLVEPGKMIISWADLTLQNDGITLTDGAVFFELCFDVTGELGDCSPLILTDDPRPTEVVNANGNRISPFVREGKVNITDDPFFALVTQDSASCITNNDGAFTVTVDEATAPYRFRWNNIPLSGMADQIVIIGENGGSETVTDLAPGRYGVTITDSSVPPLEVIDTVEVISGPELGATISFDQPSCRGFSDSEIRAEVLLDGVNLPNPGPTYSYSWNVTTDNTRVLTDRPRGFYAVTITDDNGCTAMASLTTTEPPLLTVTTANTFITRASCSGGANGEIRIIPSGGTTADGNYNFLWESGLMARAGTSTRANLNPGQYCVTVTDDNNCSFEECYTVGAIKTLNIVPAADNVTCNGADDGLILVSGSTSGAAADEPYTFSWNNTGSTPPVNTATTSQIGDLMPGQYIVTMTDSDPAGCQIIDTIDISEPLALTIQAGDIVGETCVTGNDGSASVIVSGGTLPYTYSWSHSMAVTDSVATGLQADDYTVVVTDQNNCSEQLMVVVGAPAPPIIQLLDDDSVTCPDDSDGSLQVVAVPAPGTGTSLSYLWNTGDTDQILTALSPGEYIVTVTGENQCSVIDTAYVTAPDSIRIDDFTIRQPSCPGETDAQISVIVTGGQAPYTYAWSNGAPPSTTANPLTMLGEGTYTLNIFDINNCTLGEIASFDVVDPPSIVAANVGDNGFTNLVPTSCPEDTSCDGQATFTAMYSDGTMGNFNYTWDSGESDVNAPSSTATQLCEGPNQIVVGDGVCGTTFDFDVAAPENISAVATIEPVRCNGEFSGSVSLVPSGGTGPYTFFWVETSETTSAISGLDAGSYTAVITDDNSCVFTQSVIVEEPAPLIAAVEPIQSTEFVTCAGDEDGVIVLIPTGGNANAANPYLYNWSNGQTTARIDELPAGTYTVTVSDFEGCFDELSFIIQEPDPVSFALDPIVPPLCFGDPTAITIDTAFGGANNAFEEYVFMIDNNGLRIPVIQPGTLFAGDHTVTVEDINGCSSETMINIPSPGQISVTIANPDPLKTSDDPVIVELGDSLTQLITTVTPSGNYTYQWTPADFLSSDTVQSPFVYPEGSLEYNLVVVNENGCFASTSIFVELDANRNVYIPEIFSPNGDGVNDEFQIFACRGVRNVRNVRIFDRWGGLVFEKNNLPPDCLNGTSGTGNAWEGFSADQELMPTGVYVYMIEIEFLDDVVLTYRGDVTLVR